MLVTKALVGTGLFISLASAGCFTRGAQWDRTDTAIRTVDSVCDDLGGREYSDVGNARSNCRNSPTGLQKWEFKVRRSSGGPRTLQKGDCQRMLKREITGCKEGGKRNYPELGFEFT